MRIVSSLIAVLVLLLVVYVGVDLLGLRWVFGVLLPYVAIALFIGGFIYRVVRWARVPVPFHIPTTCGQQRSLSWIEHNRVECPQSKFGVFVRMALEVLIFRSLMRNTRTENLGDGRLVHGTTKWLWATSLVFHWCFLIVLFRHARFFLDPVPSGVSFVAGLDGFLQIGVPGVYITGVLLLASVTVLFLRRVVLPQVKYISLPADYFPLFLLIAIAASGLLLRHYVRADIVGAKEVAMGLMTFKLSSVPGIHWLVYAHLTLVMTLIGYFPFSKLMHMGGVFLSPTRNLACNSRKVRHINPWDHPVRVHSYEEYEDEFRDKMKAAGIPVDKE